MHDIGTYLNNDLSFSSSWGNFPYNASSFYMIPSGKQTWLWKMAIYFNPFQKWRLSIAMLVYQMANPKKYPILKLSLSNGFSSGFPIWFNSLSSRISISQESDHPTGRWLVPFQFHRRPRRPQWCAHHDSVDSVLAPGAGEGVDHCAGHGDVAGMGGLDTCTKSLVWGEKSVTKPVVDS